MRLPILLGCKAHC